MVDAYGQGDLEEKLAARRPGPSFNIPEGMGNPAKVDFSLRLGAFYRKVGYYAVVPSIELGVKTAATGAVGAGVMTIVELARYVSGKEGMSLENVLYGAAASGLVGLIWGIRDLKKYWFTSENKKKYI